ncbi:THO complex subunit Tho1 [Rasamsonia emersonii CBS 393.64]|uniref:THO complex subunit Tho1 n=1 Tax=Rasamsonia emersonii (strain ATCC 16479 / CBS 393.64 / IMI 116815) TaxID=1408163 RepID=A0A0F4YV81_RASE3|nr:THO complex subunit Tho1 [Rasamsonia emersonii CBS 393.64]KKA22020.1 THO complex subunit Tho1 [Rasamsonia emersonii CBS 393.64]
MFQSFPLGDKSSVNLRGEFHTENVTTFDEIPKKQKHDEMETDTTGANEAPAESEAEKPVDDQKLDGDQSTEEAPKPPEVVVSDNKDAEKEKSIDLDALYPIFWGLQAYFSSPTKLFDSQHFASFKSGLEATLSTFKLINTDLDTRSAAKTPDEVRRGVKRKRTGDGAEISSTFNPKYLTSRELFDLEVNDIAFRRHVLVQALILLDFILSLTPKARSRLPKTINRAVVYNYVASEEDAKWAAQTRDAIAEYLQQGLEGKFYYRMVDTVLSRDKNWVRWKVENCPPIERPAVSLEDYLDARENATKVFSSKRLRPSPMGSLDLKFLSDAENGASLERLKDPDRFRTPAPDSYMMGIVDDDFDIDMAKTKEEKDDAMRAKASKVWRTLRLTAKSKLGLFDKIEDGNNLKVLFESPQPPEEAKKASTDADKTPQNTENPDEKDRPADSQKETNDATPREAEQPPTEATAS